MFLERVFLQLLVNYPTYVRNFAVWHITEKWVHEEILLKGFVVGTQDLGMVGKVWVIQDSNLRPLSYQDSALTI